MNWKPYTGSDYTKSHQTAETEHGEIVAGPRKRDGFWEFLPPDVPGCDDYPEWRGDAFYWTEAECKAQAANWVRGIL